MCYIPYTKAVNMTLRGWKNQTKNCKVVVYKLNIVNFIHLSYFILRSIGLEMFARVMCACKVEEDYKTTELVEDMAYP